MGCELTKGASGSGGYGASCDNYEYGADPYQAYSGLRGKDNTTKYQLAADATVKGAETSPIGNQWWQRIPDHGPDQARGL